MQADQHPQLYSGLPAQGQVPQLPPQQRHSYPPQLNGAPTIMQAGMYQTGDSNSYNLEGPMTSGPALPRRTSR